MKTTTIEQLKKGETLLTNIRAVSGNKFQIEIAEFILNPEATLNVAALLNKGDDRFSSSSKPRRAWQSATAEGLLMIGVDVAELTFNEVDGKSIAVVNMLNPAIEGERLHVRIIDSLEKSYEGQQPKMVNGKDGVTYFMKEGNHIYQSTQIVAGEANHTIIKSDERAIKAAVKTKVSVMSLNA